MDLERARVASIAAQQGEDRDALAGRAQPPARERPRGLCEDVGHEPRR